MPDIKLNPGGVIGGLLGLGAAIAVVVGISRPNPPTRFGGLVGVGVIGGAVAGNYLWSLIVKIRSVDEEPVQAVFTPEPKPVQPAKRNSPMSVTGRPISSEPIVMAEAVAEAKLAAPCETLFFARTWILAIGTCIFGSFAFFSLMMSPLFLFRIMKDAFGKPAVGAGIGLGVAGAFCLGLAALLFFQWNARRKPILQLFREGIKVHHIGPDSRSVSQYLPSRYRLLWQLISFEGFRSRTFYAPWKQFQNTQVAGSEMARYLRIVASFYELNRDPSGKPTLYGQALGFEETRLRTPLPQIAAAIHFMHRNADHRARLASWKE